METTTKPTEERFMRNEFAKKLHKFIREIRKELCFDTTNHQYQLKHNSNKKENSMFPCDDQTAEEIRDQLQVMRDKYPVTYVEFVTLP